jgi:hypothetical protein
MFGALGQSVARKFNRYVGPRELQPAEPQPVEQAHPQSEPLVSPRPNWAENEQNITNHFSNFPILAPRLPENVERLATLERDGVVFIEGLFQGELLDRLRSALAPDMDRMRHETLDLPREQWLRVPEAGRYRLYRIDQRVPETIAFRDHRVLLDLVQAYMSGNAEFVQLALELRRQPPDWDAALGDLIPHFDYHLREIKIYLALEDITNENGPIVFWTGTHRQAQWRRLPDYLASIGGLWAESHILNHNTVVNLMQKSPEFANCREVRCTLKAGSAFVCDTRGMHRASFLNAGERWHIYSAYNLKGAVRNSIKNPNWLQPLDLS